MAVLWPDSGAVSPAHGDVDVFHMFEVVELVGLVDFVVGLGAFVVVVVAAAATVVVLVGVVIAVADSE